MNAPQFDATTARQARDEAIDQVDRNARSEWKATVTKVIWWLAVTREEFTTDPVWYLLDKLEADPPHEQRALGALMQKAAKAGWIVKTDRVIPSVRAKCHARPLAVWRSRIHSETQVHQFLNKDATSIEAKLRSLVEGLGK